MRARTKGPGVLVRGTMPYAAALFSFPGWEGAGGSVEVDVRVGSQRLTAVVTTFVRGLPGDRSKGALEEGVVDDVAFVILSFDDPVAGIGFALSAVGEDHCGVEALRGVD